MLYILLCWPRLLLLLLLPRPLHQHGLLQEGLTINGIVQHMMLLLLLLR
jgi:hypothetical protein